MLAGPWKEYPLCLQRAGLPAQWFAPHESGSNVPVQSRTIEGRVVGLPPGAAAHVYE